MCKHNERERLETWAVVVAQLVERLPQTPEACSLNPVIGQIYIDHLLTVNCIEKTKIKNRGREWPIFLQKVINIGTVIWTTEAENKFEFQKVKREAEKEKRLKWSKYLTRSKLNLFSIFQPFFVENSANQKFCFTQKNKN